MDRLDPAQAPWLRALLTLELARIHDAIGDRPAATVEARAARSLLASLDVVLAPEDARLLERLMAPAPAPPAAEAVASLHRHERRWSASFAGSSVLLPDGKGMRYLSELLAQPGIEQYALDLVDRLEGVNDEAELARRALAGSLPQLDARARSDYRKRIEDLRGMVSDALERGNFEAAELAQGELDQLVRQLAQAFGLGGKERPTGSVAERARLNVTRALRSAISRISEALPKAGAALDRQVRTGSYCAYEPQNGLVSWSFTPE